MRRVVDFLLRNWPLKLAAVLLATMLYSGLVLSQSVRTFTGVVPVDPIRFPAGATLLNEIDPVREIRFRAPLDVGALSPDSFRATVNLSNVEPREGGEPQEVSVRLESIHRQVQIVDFAPRTVPVRLDFIEEREVPVTVEHNVPPEGLSVGVPQVEPSDVRIRGASSRVDAVHQVVARVTIDSSALNVSREVALVPVDADGNEVPDVEVEPNRATVRIAVAVELAHRTLAVRPQLVGELPSGYAMRSISVEPLAVTVSGSQDVVTRLDSAPSQPIDLGGRTRDFQTTVELQLPEQVEVIGTTQVTVSVVVEPMRGSRTFLVGLTLEGASPQLVYQPAVSQLVVTLQGPLAELDAVDPAQLVGQLDVTDLEPGNHLLPVTLSTPPDLQLLSMTPAEILVRVEEPPEGGSAPPIGFLSESRL